jgi:hypothetical protein
MLLHFQTQLMHSFTQTDDTVIEPLDWDLIVTSRLNAIICGDRDALDARIGMLGDHLEAPVLEWSCAREPSPPSMAGGTLIVKEIEAASPNQQRVLLGWAGAHGAVRIITVTEAPLFDLVAGGTLIEQLYYRLNAIYCALSPRCSFSSTGADRSSAA